MIEVRLIGDKLMLAKMQARNGLVRDALRNTIQRLAITLQQEVKSKLSGEVLKNQTGNLRSSINQQVLETFEGVVASVGTNVVYAARHEYGFQGTETVAAHVRRSRAQINAATRSYTNKRGETVLKVARTGRRGIGTGDIQVRSFTRKANTPERSFLRASLRELSGSFRSDMARAVIKALK